MVRDPYEVIENSYEEDHIPEEPLDIPRPSCLDMGLSLEGSSDFNNNDAVLEDPEP
jgi:hypothetical protein